MRRRSIVQGEYHVASESGFVIATLLGSCVAACLRDPVARVGGMNHFLLGEPGAGKTTYLCHLAFLCARKERLPDYLPLFLRLRDLAGMSSLEDALLAGLAQRRFPNAANYLRRQLASGRRLAGDGGVAQGR